MKKRFIGLFLMIPLVMTITTVLATEGIKFNIDGYQKLAIENSKQGLIDELEIKAMESALEDAKEDAEFTVLLGTTQDMYNGSITREVKPLEAQANLELAKKTKDKNTEDANFNIYKEALNVLLLQKQLDTESAKLDMLKEKYKMAQARLKEGKITDNDLDDSGYAVDTKTIEVDKVKKDMEAANLELKRLINVKMDESPVEIEEELVFSGNLNVDMSEVIEKAMAKSVEIYQKEQDFKAKEKTSEIAQKLYNEGDFTYNNDKANFEIAKVELEEAKTKIEVDVRNKYNTFLTAKDSVDMATKWEQICQSKLDSAKLKYEKGLISREELFNAEEKSFDAKYAKFATTKDYNVLKAEFELLYK
jgi:outer membrane protein TolC